MVNVQKKDGTVKAKREKSQVTHKGRPVRITTNCSVETMKTRRDISPIHSLCVGQLLLGMEPTHKSG